LRHAHTPAVICHLAPWQSCLLQTPQAAAPQHHRRRCLTP
jgi:hypothetical protein